MSAPTPASGDSSPTPGYYPDPSIPGYVRFWNGASWVPGTSRPAPSDGEGMPAVPAGTAPSAPAPAPTPAVEETGPHFFDEEPEGAHLHGSPPEPASAWQADTSRQTGFGGERDRRVSWGSPQPDPATGTTPPAAGGTPEDPRRAAAPTPRDASGDQRRGSGGVDLRRTGGSAPEASPGAAPRGGTPPAPAEAGPRGTGGADPSGGALPGVRTPPPHDGTVTIRAQRRGDAESPRTAQADGTMAIRTMTPGAGRPQVPGQARPGQGQTPGTPQAQAPAQAQPQGQVPPQPHAPGRAPAPGQGQPPVAPGPQAGGGIAAAPVSSGAGGGAASWAQQVHQLAQPDRAEAGAPPVVPWKPPVSDPFLQAAQAQAAARPAGLAKRLAARLIDTVVLGAGVSAVGLPLVSAALAHIDDKIEAAKLSGETVTVWLLDGTTAGYFGIVLGAYLLLGVVYEVLPTAKWGRTLGKKLCRMHVRDIEAHEPPTFGAALRRWLVYGVLGVLAVGVVNAAWCLFDRPWRQCWHDKAARTFVAGD
ncbi:RDD family protein [Streptomyces sp. ISL-96]|uniref:RDD family protein n=1 Tax=Streptomyces sp. ISL-96 TaxID=2819191 RepID=UPI001BEA03E0|nr:RDD family protein [Streptomyces sp. ISL-96]MBT2491251.1 RDD family protein [Streptomyces sp. ISL-96]